MQKIFQNTLLTVFVLAGFFHILVLAQIVPYQYTWGGKLESLEQMYVFESISLLVNSFFLWGVWAGKRWVFYLVAAMGVLNTLGNLQASTWQEKAFGGLATALFCLCALGYLQTASPAPKKRK